MIMKLYAFLRYRVFLDQYGGVEMSSDGSKRQKWSWKDLLKQEPAFPLQPICIKLNRHIAIRIISQENIILTFSANQRNCRFNIGSKLKVSTLYLALNLNLLVWSADNFCKHFGPRSGTTKCWA